MRYHNRFVLTMIAVILLLVSVIGCSQSSEEVKDGKAGTNETAGNNNSTGKETDGLPMSNGKYDPPVTITTVRGVGGDLTFKNGEKIENNVHLKWAKEKLGIDIKYLWTVTDTNDAFKTKLRLSLSANQKMPDIVALRSDVDKDMIDSGKFMEVGELFDRYASQTWKDAMNEDPSVWYPYMRDGKRYGIPILDYAYNADPVLWIREDWLKKLNLTAPKTIEDMERIMEAFTNQDPDGNGVKDTVGLTIGFKNWVNTWMSDAGWVFGAYGAMPNQWNEKPDGTLEYGSVSTEAKAGLAKLREWMEKGLIPKEAGLFDETKATELFTAGKAGMVAGPHWMPWWPLEDVKKNVKGAEYKAYPIPSGPDGKAGRHDTASRNGVVLINKDMKNPEVFFTYQNYLFEHYANPAAGSEFENGMAKGYDWDEVNGKVVVGGEVPGGAVPVNKYTLTFDGARIPSLSMKTLAKLANGEEAVTPYEKTTKAASPATVLEAARIVLDQKAIVMPQKFVGAPTETMMAKNELLQKMEKETFSKIIYGKVPLEEFDKFVKEWNSAGGEKVTKEVNDWYATVTSK
ncbi:sugar ABC transporter [Paenibacillus swuensis]|uniref:Sugar ABC transporter n=1 Tax=Paenibacillus swuensis TaxID=1178515 RepID=A0A172TF87_9BACL|nr:extracellular solute-binding protein [Paenibacillus swuensis]ANE45719.1 sugar ABC transporter [Paenibacillus swuensis]